MKDARRIAGAVALGTVAAGAAYLLGTRKAHAPEAPTTTEPERTPQNRPIVTHDSFEPSATDEATDSQPAARQIVDQLLAELGDQAVIELKSGLKRGLQRLEKVIDEL